MRNKKINKLDKALLVLGYFAATFILLVTVVGIILAIIKMHRNGTTTIELPQAEAEPVPLLLPDAALSDRNMAETQIT